jgi:hypothetical protein
VTLIASPVSARSAWFIAERVGGGEHDPWLHARAFTRQGMPEHWRRTMPPHSTTSASADNVAQKSSALVKKSPISAADG